MPLTPDDVANKKFRLARRGYSLDEVDAFCDEVHSELSRLLREVPPPLGPAAPTDQAAPTDPAATALPAAVPHAVGQDNVHEAAAPTSSHEAPHLALRTLTLAQRTADQVIQAAHEEAGSIVTSARGAAAAAEEASTVHVASILQSLEAREAGLRDRIEQLNAFEREYRSRLTAYLRLQLRELAGGGGADEDDPSPEDGEGPPTTSEVSLTAPVQLVLPPSAALTDQVPEHAGESAGQPG